MDFDEVAKLIPNLENSLADRPLHLQRDGKDVAVIVPAEEYISLLRSAAGPGVRPEIVELHHASMRKHRRIYEALAEWERKFDPPVDR